MTRKEFIKTGSAAATAAGFTGCLTATAADKLALLGGTPVIGKAEAAKRVGIFAWPIVNEAMLNASNDVLRKRKMSGTDITKEFEAKFAAWNGTKYALACLNGTTALNTAFYAIGLPPGVTPKQLTGNLPVSDDINNRLIGDPWCKHFDKPVIDRYVEAVHKVAANVSQLKDYKGKARFAYWS